MIDLGRPPLHAAGLTIFPDHADPGLYYYLPDRPRLRRGDEGAPELRLVKYRLSPEGPGPLGGGLLSVTVDLGVDPDVLEDARGRLGRYFGSTATPKLTAVVADAGTASLVVVQGEGTPVAKVLGAGQPSLYGDNAATFVVALDVEGATLADRSLQGGGLPFGVVYALQVAMLRPALHARVTARWQDAWHYFEDRFHGGVLLLQADVGPIVQDLIRNEFIQIEVDQLLPDEEKTKAFEQAVDRVERYVLETFFQPTLGQAPPAERDGGVVEIVHDVISALTFTWSLRTVDRGELKTLTYDLSAARAETLTLSPQGSLADLLAPEDHAADLVQEVDLSDDGRRKLVAHLFRRDDDELDHVALHLSYGPDRRDYTLDAQHLEATMEAARLDDTRFHAGWEVYFQPQTVGPARVDVPEAETQSRVLVIDPGQACRWLQVQVAAMGVPFDEFPTVLVDLELTAPDPAEGGAATLTLTQDAPAARWRARARLDADVTLRRRVRYVGADGSAAQSLDWAPCDPGVLPVGDPLPGRLSVNVLASARFGTEVERLIVEIRPQGRPDLSAALLLTREQPNATWRVALPEPLRAYEYRVTVHTVRGEVRTGEWQTDDRPLLIVGESILKMRDVQLLLVGSPAALGLLGVKVRFAFSDDEAGLSAEDERLVTDTAQPVKWTYAIADAARQAYTYQLTLIHADGTLDERPPVTTESLLVVERLG